jgi:hypothetical protein
MAAKITILALNWLNSNRIASKRISHGHKLGSVAKSSKRKKSRNEEIFFCPQKKKPEGT